ncbi:hypothetical protein CsSME_00010291 [Camellia sinensis var. sinensis]
MAVDAIHANYYLGALFHALIILFFYGFPELSMTVGRLAVFSKQRDLYFYPAWAYAIPATILKVPLSMLTLTANTTIGQETLESRGLHCHGYLFWISLDALLGFIIIFNIGFTLSLTFLTVTPGSRAIISNEKLSQIQGSEDSSGVANAEVKSTDSPNTTTKSHKGRAFRPGVLTALMGVSGAGKTTLMDVLAGRKTSGTIEGDIRIGGFPKVQETFARISGYCEQTDIHSPQITVEESMAYSAWLRLHPEIDSKTKFEFVKEVLEIIELDEIKDCLVGMPGVSGLSTEQRKRLTISVKLVANPSIIFMDEPTTGLDAKAAAIVMQAMKNIIARPSICCPLLHHTTWMLDVTSTSAEAELGVVSPKNNKELVNRWSTPPPDSKGLYFATRLSQNGDSSNAASGSNTCLTGEVQHIQHAAFRVHDCNIFAFLGTVLESRKEIVSKSN